MYIWKLSPQGVIPFTNTGGHSCTTADDCFESGCLCESHKQEAVFIRGVKPQHHFSGLDFNLFEKPPGVCLCGSECLWRGREDGLSAPWAEEEGMALWVHYRTKPDCSWIVPLFTASLFHCSSFVTRFLLLSLLYIHNRDPLARGWMTAANPSLVSSEVLGCTPGDYWIQLTVKTNGSWGSYWIYHLVTCLLLFINEVQLYLDLTLIKTYYHIVMYCLNMIFHNGEKWKWWQSSVIPEQICFPGIKHTAKCLFLKLLWGVWLLMKQTEKSSDAYDLKQQTRPSVRRLIILVLGYF